jgi:hypothetical protein
LKCKSRKANRQERQNDDTDLSGHLPGRKFHIRQCFPDGSRRDNGSVSGHLCFLVGYASRMARISANQRRAKPIPLKNHVPPKRRCRDCCRFSFLGCLADPEGSVRPKNSDPASQTGLHPRRQNPRAHPPNHKNKKIDSLSTPKTPLFPHRCAPEIPRAQTPTGLPHERWARRNFVN